MSTERIATLKRGRGAKSSKKMLFEITEGRRQKAFVLLKCVNIWESTWCKTCTGTTGTTDTTGARATTATTNTTGTTATMATTANTSIIASKAEL